MLHPTSNVQLEDKANKKPFDDRTLKIQKLPLAENFSPAAQQGMSDLERGWLSGIDMDLHKSQILDGVLVQTQNRMSRCLKSHASVSQFFGTKCTHSRVPGLKVEALFQNFQAFLVSANRR